MDTLPHHKSALLDFLSITLYLLMSFLYQFSVPTMTLPIAFLFETLPRRSCLSTYPRMGRNYKWWMQHKIYPSIACAMRAL